MTPDRFTAEQVQPDRATSGRVPPQPRADLDAVETIRRRCPELIDRFLVPVDGVYRVRAVTDGHRAGEWLLEGIREQLGPDDRLVVDGPADVMVLVLAGDHLGRQVSGTIGRWVGPIVVVVLAGSGAGDVAPRVDALRGDTADAARGTVTVFEVPESERSGSDVAHQVVDALRRVPRLSPGERLDALRREAMTRMGTQVAAEHARIQQLTAERADVIARRNGLRGEADDTRRRLQGARVHVMAVVGSAARGLDLEVRELAVFTRGRLDDRTWHLVDQRIVEATTELSERLGIAAAAAYPPVSPPPSSHHRAAHSVPKPVPLVAPRLPAPVSTSASAGSPSGAPSAADVAFDASEGGVLPPIPGRAATDRAAPIIGAVVGAGAGRATAAALGLPTANPVTTALMVLGAVLMVLVTLRARRRPIERAGFERWCSAAVAEVRASWERGLLDVLLDLEARAVSDAERLRRGRLDTADALLHRIDEHLGRGRAAAIALERDVLVVVGGVAHPARAPGDSRPPSETGTAGGTVGRLRAS